MWSGRTTYRPIIRVYYDGLLGKEVHTVGIHRTEIGGNRAKPIIPVVDGHRVLIKQPSHPGMNRSGRVIPSGE